MPTDGRSDARTGEVLGNVFVLAWLAVFLVLLPPNLKHLSGVLVPDSHFSPDILGGTATGVGMLLWVAYFVLAVRAIRHAQCLRIAIVASFAVLYFVLPMLSDISARRDLGIQSGGKYVSFPHDGGVLQTEAAMDFLLEGRNPYSAEYGRTAMAESHHSRRELWRRLGFERNPAFGFFPYPPGILILSIPPRGIGHLLFGWYDQRLVYLLALPLLGLLAYRFPAEESLRLPLLAIVAVSPLHARFFVQGFNDILCGLFVLGTIYASSRRNFRSGALLLGIACGLKQFAWILVPLYLALLYGEASGTVRVRLRSVGATAWPLFVTIGVLFLPFLAWDPGRFIYSLITAQGTVFPFRAASLGISNFLILSGLVDSPRDAFPSYVLYLVLVAPVTLFALRDLVLRPKLSVLLLWYFVVLFLFLFTSRFFAFNYLWLLSVVGACALITSSEEQTIGIPNPAKAEENS